jgi:predicted PurR-regulated permease PerM
MDRKLFLTLLAYTGLIGALILLYYVLQPFLSAIIWASVVAIATFPIYRRLCVRLNDTNTHAPALMTLGVFLLIVLPVSGMIAALVHEILKLQTKLNAADASHAGALLERLLNDPHIAPWVEKAQQFIASTDIDLRGAALSGAKQLTGLLLGGLTALVKNVFMFVFQLLLIVIVLFFIYRDGQAVERGFWSLIPLEPEARERLRTATERMVGGVVVGVLGTALVQGILGGLGFWFADLPSPVLFGALIFLAAMVPVVGAALVWVPASAYLFIAADITTAVIFTLWSALVVGGIDNILRPLLISGRTGMPLPLIMLGALGGLFAFGFIGLVLGPLLITLLLSILQPRTEPEPAQPVTT